MRTIGRFGASILGLAVVVAGWSLEIADADYGFRIRPDIVVFSEDPAHMELARWAVARFENAGLKAPAVEIAFHTDAAGCGDHFGYAKGGRVDICTVLVNEMTRRNLLHEMGHIWIDENVDEALRERFLERRGLLAWNASTVPWEERGYEHGAEIMAWALGTGILTAQIPDHDPVQLAVGFELLTGVGTPMCG
jgi:hypothetical protein